MPLLVRRISRAKWEQSKIEDKDDVFADAITSCLRTFNNDLSVWKVENESKLEDAILALITGSKQTKLSTLHFVIIEENIVLEKGLILNDTNGDTVIPGLIKNHRDISELTYKKLGILKSIILNSIGNNKSAFYTRKQLKDLIKKALNDGRLCKEKLNEELVRKEKF